MDGYLGFFVAADDGESDDDKFRRLMGFNSQREKTLQIIISLALGVSAFLTFCALRPRWTGLYAARKKHKDETRVIPELPQSLFGWILPVWRITEQQILASAGLDAYVFLAFFKMAMKFLVVTLFFSILIIKPIHDAHPEEIKKIKKPSNDSDDDMLYRLRPTTLERNGTNPILFDEFETDYLWMYVAFAYLFSALAFYLMITSTRRVIAVRQEYLGAQTSLADRTIRLSGIPIELREEEKIKDFIESLDIGKVESVTLCRNWKELDGAVEDRMNILRRLEEAYTIHLGRRRVERNLESLPIVQPTLPSPRPLDTRTDAEDADEESAALIATNGAAHGSPYEKSRPRTRIRYGFLKLRSKKVDAIDYHEEKLRQADERIRTLRKKEFTPTPLAFVIMDSVAACQMAIQAVLDPIPKQLIAKQSPAPSDVIWANTYMSRRNRTIRAWCITSLILVLTLFWSSVFLAIAGLTTLESIGKVFPQIIEFLEKHKNIQSIVNAQLPTLMASLLLILVPYLYYWLSWYQGFMSQGDVELSAISKNFFFTFFNFFVIMTLGGAGIKFYEIFQQIGKAMNRDISKIAHYLAVSLQQVAKFYINFIILQGLGLFPFRLLEVGSVSLYPVYRIGAKTPRDYAELVQPPVFSYGFYLPSALLIFIICMVYSVLRSSWEVLLAGLVYFALGYFVYKYQLLYAMDSQQQATGQAWIMICDRIFVGMLFFQLATTGQLLLQNAVKRGALMVPLLIATVWVALAFGKTYKPLMNSIALRSIKRGEQYADQDPPDTNSISSTDLAPERRAWAEPDGSQAHYHQEVGNGFVRVADEPDEAAARFVNPSLVASLHPVWIADKDFRRDVAGEVSGSEESA